MASTKKTTSELMRAKILRERRQKLQIAKYVPKEKNISGRIAEFIDDCARNYPHSIVTYEEITQAIFSLGKIPDARAKHVKSVRGQMCAAGKLLMEKYRRSLITCRGVGARASVDDTDVLRESVTKDAERHRQTAAKLKKTADLVDPKRLAEELKDMKGDPVLKQEMIELSSWFQESLTKYLKTLDRPQNERALLPPPPAMA